MAVKIPDTLQEFLEEMARRSLQLEFHLRLGLDMPAQIAESQEEVEQAAEEWQRQYADVLRYFAIAAKRARRRLPELVPANASFVSDCMSLPGVNFFLDDPHQQYVCELIADACVSAEKFGKLLGIFEQLAP